MGFNSAFEGLTAVSKLVILCATCLREVRTF
jgi:hypothetical protein